MKDEMSLLAASEVVLSRPRWVVVYPAAAAVLALFATFLVHPRYTASVAFVAERLGASGGRATLAGLAGQYGLNILTDVFRPPAYYVSVLESRQLKEQVLESRVTRDSVPVRSLLEIEEGSRAESLAAGVAILEDMVRIHDDPRTSVITVAIETKDPELSAAIAMRFVDALKHFTTTQRQAQAGERRRFLESRIATARVGVREAEARLRSFYQSNPSWTQRPALVVENARLRTTLDGASELAISLQRESELARIEELSDMPVLTIIDPAVPPLRRSWPRRTAIFVGVFVVAVFVGALAALVADYLARARVENPETFARLSRSLRPWRR